MVDRQLPGPESHGSVNKTYRSLKFVIIYL